MLSHLLNLRYFTQSPYKSVYIASIHLSVIVTYYWDVFVSVSHLFLTLDMILLRGFLKGIHKLALKSNYSTQIEKGKFLAKNENKKAITDFIARIKGDIWVFQ